MSKSDSSEQFVRQLTENQNRIYGYVFSLVGDHTRSADVVQEVNLVLWRKIADFDPKRPFLPWAFAIARMQVLAHLRDNQRDRLLIDAELAEQLCEEAGKQAEDFDSVRVALRSCMSQLSATNRDLVQQRYFRTMSINEVAQASNRSVSAVKVALMRSRQALAQCVERMMAVEEMSR